MVHPHNFGSALRILFKFLHNERGQEVYENYNDGFSEKILILGKWFILVLKLVHPHKSGSALRIFLNFSTMKGVKRYIKVVLVVFLKKFTFGADGLC